MLGVAASLLVAAVADVYMNCSGVKLCGVLTLETGLSSQGHYRHPKPAVHGLWPQVGRFGSSACVRPSGSTAPPEQLAPCYNDSSSGASHQLNFERHEWVKHGMCAGAANATDYFEQVCALAASPLAVMSRTRESGKSAVEAFATDLTSSGYPVWSTDEVHSQVELSACAGTDGIWKLSELDDMRDHCADSGDSAVGPHVTSDPAGALPLQYVH